MKTEKPANAKYFFPLAMFMILLTTLIITQPTQAAACNSCGDPACPKELDPEGDRNLPKNPQTCTVDSQGNLRDVDDNLIPIPPVPSYAYCVMKFLKEYCGAYDAFPYALPASTSTGDPSSITVHWGERKQSTYYRDSYVADGYFGPYEGYFVKKGSGGTIPPKKPYVYLFDLTQPVPLHGKDNTLWEFYGTILTYSGGMCGFYYDIDTSSLPYTHQSFQLAQVYGGSSLYGLYVYGSNLYAYVFLRSSPKFGSPLCGIELWTCDSVGTCDVLLSRVTFFRCGEDDPMGPEGSMKGARVEVFDPATGAVVKSYYVFYRRATVGAGVGQVVGKIDGVSADRLFSAVKLSHPGFAPGDLFSSNSYVQTAAWGYVEAEFSNHVSQAITYYDTGASAGRVESITNCSSCGSSGQVERYAYGNAGSGPGSLTAHWRFDSVVDRMGAAWTDASVGGVHGEVTDGMGGATVMRGKVNGAIELNGSSRYITMNNDLSQRPVLRMSFGGWFQFKNLTDNQVLVTKYDTTNNAGYKLVLAAGDPGLGTPATIRATIRIDDGSGGGSDVSVSFPVSEVDTTDWWHIVATYDEEHVRLYLNGVEKASVAAAGSIVHSTGQLRVGAELGTPSAFFDGAVDELCIYNYALSPVELICLAAGEENPLGAANLNFWDHWRSTDTRKKDANGKYSSGGTVSTLYYNAEGMVVHQRVQEYERAAVGGSLVVRSVSDSHEHYIYNGERKLVAEYSPAAWAGTWTVVNANASYPNPSDHDDFAFNADGTFEYMEHLHTDQGLITQYEYHSDVGGLKTRSIRQGTEGTRYPVVEYEYYSPTNIGRTDLLRRETRYLNPVSTVAADGSTSAEDNSSLVPEVTEYYYQGTRTAPTTGLLSSDFWDGSTAKYPKKRIVKRWLNDTGSRALTTYEDLDSNGLVTRLEEANGDGVIVSSYSNTMIASRTVSAPGLSMTTSYGYASGTMELKNVTTPTGEKTEYLTVYGVPKTIGGVAYTNLAAHITYPNLHQDASGDYITVGPVTVTYSILNGPTLRRDTAKLAGKNNSGGAPVPGDLAKLVPIGRTDYIYDNAGRLVQERVYHSYFGNTGAFAEEEAEGSGARLTYNTTTYIYGPDGALKCVLDAAGVRTYNTRWAKYYAGVGAVIEERQYTVHKSGSTWTLLEPIQVTWSDPQEGRTLRTWSAAVALTGEPDGTENLNVAGAELSRTTYTYDWRGRSASSRIYIQLPATLSDVGTEGTHYYISSHSLAYDHQDNLLRGKSAGGVISAQVYDLAGRGIESWIGTNAAGATRDAPSNGGAGANDMKRVDLTFYGVDKAGVGTPTDYVTSVMRLRPGVTDPSDPLDPSDYVAVEFGGPYDLYTIDNGSARWARLTKPSVGPWSAEIMDNSGRVVASYIFQNNNGTPGTIFSKTTNAYDNYGRLTASIVHEIGTAAVAQTTYEYDEAGRLSVVTRPDAPDDLPVGSPAGSSTLTEYDRAGRQIRQSLHDWDVGQTVLQVEEYMYDGVGRVAQRKLGMSSGNAVTIEKTWYDDSYDGTGVPRTHVTAVDTLAAANNTTTFVRTKYTYDSAGRPNGVLLPAASDGGDGLYRKTTFDAAGRTLAGEVYSAPNGTLLAKTEYIYSGSRLQAVRIYDGTKLATTPAWQETSFAYDPLGRQCRVDSPSGSWTFTAYDLTGNTIGTYLCAGESTPGTFADVNDDVVVEQTTYQYNELGEIWLTTHAKRKHDAQPSHDGPLDASNAVFSYTAQWFDDAGRPTWTVQYGHHDGVPITAVTDDFNPDIAGVQTYENFPSTVNVQQNSEKYVATLQQYDGFGRVKDVTDNAGRVTRTFYDILGRPKYVVENADTTTSPFNPADESGSGDATDRSKDRVTKWTYNAFGQPTTITALAPDGDGNLAKNQATRYVYAAELADKACPTPRNDLLRAVIYPDSDNTVTNNALANGPANTYNRVELTYYADGTLATRTDQRSVALAFTHDNTGRRVAQQADFPNPVPDDLNTTVQAITYAYDPLGRPAKITSHANSTDNPEDTTDIVNQNLLAYDGYGNLAREWQAVSGAVDTNSPFVAYNYASDNAAGATHARKTQLLYPAHTPQAEVSVHYLYGPAGSIGDRLARPETLANADSRGQNDAHVIADYRYNGVGHMATKSYPIPQLQLTPGHDRFGRVVAQTWQDVANPAAPLALHDIRHGYDAASNRTYADNHIYKFASQSYQYDGLNRLRNFRAGVLARDASQTPTAVNPGVIRREQGWALSQLGNATKLADNGDNAWTQSTFNLANEIIAQQTKGSGKTPVVNGNTNFPDCYQPRSSADTYTYTSGTVKFTGLAADGQCVVLYGEAVGAVYSHIYISFPAHAAVGDYIGFVFGYKSADDYWMSVYAVTAVTPERKGKLRLYHVLNGNKGAALTAGGETDWTPGAAFSLVPHFNPRWCTPNYAFAGGYPSGQMGFVTNIAPSGSAAAAVSQHQVIDSTSVAMLGRWLTVSNTDFIEPFNGDPALRSSWSSDGSYNPVILKTSRLAKFQVDFRYTHVETYYPSKSVHFCFDIQNLKDYKSVQVFNHTTTATAPAGYVAENGGQPRPVAADATYAAGVPTSPNGDPLWYRVTCDGTDVRVRVATTQAGLDTAFTSYRGSFEGKLTGGFIGFRNGQVEYIDNVSIRTDTDNDGVYETEEMIEQFNTDPVEMRYDAAGNLTFDGNYAYTSDAWGRQVEVKHAFITKDANGTKTYHEGSTISTSLYDGRGRRIRKQITNSGDQDYTYIYYYDDQRIIEERNGADQVLKTYVWGNEYIDELIQINTYIDTPQSFWAMQDANFNILGIVNESGRQVERYEYTPYGQRTIYGRQTVLSDVQEAASWANDAMLTYPQLTSARLNTTIPVSLCDFGFQGKMHDAVTGLVYYSARIYSSDHQIFMQPDRMRYVDGMNYFLFLRRNPMRFFDPMGNETVTIEGDSDLDPRPTIEVEWLDGCDPGEQEIIREKLSEAMTRIHYAANFVEWYKGNRNKKSSDGIGSPGEDLLINYFHLGQYDKSGKLIGRTITARDLDPLCGSSSGGGPLGRLKTATSGGNAKLKIGCDSKDPKKRVCTNGEDAMSFPGDRKIVFGQPFFGKGPIEDTESWRREIVIHELVHMFSGLRGDSLKMKSSVFDKGDIAKDARVYLFVDADKYWCRNTSRVLIDLGKDPGEGPGAYMGHTDTVARFINGFCNR